MFVQAKIEAVTVKSVEQTRKLKRKAGKSNLLFKFRTLNLDAIDDLAILLLL